MPYRSLVSATGTMLAQTPGMIEPPNIDLKHRPVVRNKDGTISTVRSVSFNFGGKEVLLPTITEDGRNLNTKEEIIKHFRKTGKHLGVFETPAAATAYAKALHEEQALRYSPR